MRIRDLALSDICKGENWVVSDSGELEDLNEPLENVQIRPSSEFTEDDYVVYPGVFVTQSGKATALVLLKRVGDYDYGGDYCEFVGDRWRQVGLVPDPDAEHGNEYLAAPWRSIRRSIHLTMTTGSTIPMGFVNGRSNWSRNNSFERTDRLCLFAAPLMIRPRRQWRLSDNT